MNWLLLFLHLVALGTWLGETIFFSFVVAPTLFGSLPTEQAGAAVGLIFPGYYLLGYACGVVVVLTAAGLRSRLRPAGGRWLGAALVAGGSLLACLYAGLMIQPRASALRPQLHDPQSAPSVREEFDALHRRAVQLNGAVLLGGLVIAGLLAAELSSSMRGGRRLSRYSSDPLL
jgi:uncharacterized membrane protein